MFYYIFSLLVSSIAVAQYYGNLDFRHQLQVFERRQLAEGQLRLQAGRLFYQGGVDFYTELGFLKQTRTQRVFPLRPKVQLDFYPLRSKFFRLRQYHRLALPYTPQSPRPYQTLEVLESDRPGLVYNPGLEGRVVYQKKQSFGDLKLYSSSKLYTYLYSKAQYREEFEDYALRLGTETNLGLGLSFPGKHKFDSELRLQSRSYFYPYYENGLLSHYGVQHSSNYRWRMRLRLSARFSLLNDFHQFYQGFFHEPAKNPRQRFLNVVRLTCLL